MTKQETAALIAEALHALEADAAIKALPLRAKGKLSRLHRRLHEAACEYEAELGIDVTPLSGGGLKP